MKKLCAILFVLFLAGCGTPSSGASYANCTNVSDGVAGTGVGVTTILIEGYDENILFWTVRTILTREEFNREFLQDTFLSDDEIHELFELYSQSEVEGVTFAVVELNNDYVKITRTYDYSLIPATHLNQIWNVEDFEDSITLSSAIAGLEEQEILCVINEIDEDEDEE